MDDVSLTRNTAKMAAMTAGIVIIGVILVYGFSWVGSDRPSPVNETEGDFYYYYHDERIEIDPVPGKFAIAFRPVVNEQERAAWLANGNLTLSSEVEALDLYVVESANTDLTKQELLAGSRSIAEYVTEVFRWEDGTEFVIPNQFFVQFRPSVSEEEIASLNERYGVAVVEKNEWLGNNYLLEVSWDSDVTALELANWYHENPITEFAVPDLVRLVTYH